MIEKWKGRVYMERIEEMVSATKLNEILRKRDDDKIKRTILWILAIVGAVAAIAAIVFSGSALAGVVPGRENDDEFIFVNNVGMAVEDIVVARKIFDTALERGVGTKMPL